jgi:hypothetical protein
MGKALILFASILAVLIAFFCVGHCPIKKPHSMALVLGGAGLSRPFLRRS